MAIKGKNRSRSKTKAVTRGPRPMYVEPKRPLLARRWFQVTAGIVILVLATAGIVYGIARERSQTREREAREAQARALEEYRNRIDPIVAGIGQAGQGTFAVLPEVVQGIEALRSGEGGAKVRAQARTGAKAAADAVEALQAIDVTAIVRDLPVEVVQSVIDAHEGMTDGVRLYRQVAQTVLRAAGAAGAERETLVELAAELDTIARDVFDGGYARYLAAQADAGLNPFGGGAGFPTG